MSEEINYPIKYAVLELKERGGWAVNYENITQGFKLDSENSYYTVENMNYGEIDVYGSSFQEEFLDIVEN